LAVDFDGPFVAGGAAQAELFAAHIAAGQLGGLALISDQSGESVRLFDFRV